MKQCMQIHGLTHLNLNEKYSIKKIVSYSGYWVVHPLNFRLKGARCRRSGANELTPYTRSSHNLDNGDGNGVGVSVGVGGSGGIGETAAAATLAATIAKIVIKIYLMTFVPASIRYINHYSYTIKNRTYR